MALRILWSGDQRGVAMPFTFCKDSQGQFRQLVTREFALPKKSDLLSCVTKFHSVNLLD